MYHFAHQIISSGFIVCLLALVNSKDDRDITQTINQLSSQVAGSIYRNNSQLHEFVRHDLYLLRWLEHSNFDVTRARKQILNHLEWRHAEQIDSIHLEDWSRFREDYPQFLNGTDKAGRPLAEMWLSDWDIRRAYVSGQMQSLIRWGAYLLEMSQRALYQTIKLTGNANITGATEIIDMDGFSFITHACIPCHTFYITVGGYSNEHYPNLWTRNYMTNVGQLFRSFLTVMNTRHGYNSMNALKLFSHRSECLPVLDREIDKDQRSKRFGGSVNRGN